MNRLIKLNDKVERISGDARNRGVVIEIDEQSQRARIMWTHRQKYVGSWDGRRSHTTWTGEFVEMTNRAPRTWAAFKCLKVIE